MKLTNRITLVTGRDVKKKDFYEARIKLTEEQFRKLQALNQTNQGDHITEITFQG